MNAIANKEVYFKSLGLIDYQESWDYQEQLLKRVVAVKVANRKLPPESQQPTPNYLIFCQHPHVYTLGKSGSEENLLLDQEGLTTQDARFYRINRGGDITYHGPGQIVGYPILDLDNFFTDIHRYLRTLEEAVILTLKDYGLEAGRIDGLTGVWLDYQQLDGMEPRKICALGVKASRWVTMHGFSFNVNTDLSYFDYIIPCGIEDKAVTTLAKELGRKVDLMEVGEKLKTHLGHLFGMTFRNH
ncbi:MAG: lipoyl(octanoyl) transferase LipB [Cyclobacteriaceae bacterium]